jgi:hypothetical protein
MSDRRLDPDDIANLAEIQALQGEEMPIDQDAVLEPDEMERRREPTRTELDRGANAQDLEVLEGEEATLDGLALDDLRTGETDDPVVATEEGLTYVPPVEHRYNTDDEPGEPGHSEG